MKVLLGFSFKEAKDYARERLWPIRQEQIYTLDGERVIVVLGDSRDDCQRLRGFNLQSEEDIIIGWRSIHPIVLNYARRRVRSRDVHS